MQVPPWHMRRHVSVFVPDRKVLTPRFVSGQVAGGSSVRPGPGLDEAQAVVLHTGQGCTRRVKTLLCVAGLKTSRKTKRSELCWLQHFLCYMCNIFVMNVTTKSVHSIIF